MQPNKNYKVLQSAIRYHSSKVRYLVLYRYVCHSMSGVNYICTNDTKSLAPYLLFVELPYWCVAVSGFCATAVMMQEVNELVPSTPVGPDKAW